jgi:predicted secreted protein
VIYDELFFLRESEMNSTCAYGDAQCSITQTGAGISTMTLAGAGHEGGCHVVQAGVGTGKMSFTHASVGRLRNWVGLVCMAVIAAPALAQVQPVSADAPQQVVKHAWPQATLSAEASTVVAQDTVKITLATELTDASQAKVSAELGATLNEIMKRAKADAAPGVKVYSGTYSLYPTTDKNGKIASWRGRAEVILESNDFAAASKLASKLDDRAPIASLAFSVSRDARAKAEQSLLAQAVKSFQSKALALTRAFDFSTYTLRSVELGGLGVQPYQPAPRMMAMAADKVAVPLEGGTERVTVSVRGSIVLQGKK